MKRILFINPFGIGDVLFTTPLVRALKESMPDSYICYWCNERVGSLLEYHPGVDEVIPCSRGDMKKIFQRSFWEGCRVGLGVFSRLRNGRFDSAVDFSLDHRYGFCAKMAGIKKRIGFNFRKRGRFLTDKIDIEGYSGKHVIEYYLELLRFLHIEPRDAHMEVAPQQEASASIRSSLLHRGVTDQDLCIGIVAGAGESWGLQARYKQWPMLKFAALVDKISAELKAKVLLLGSGQEREIADTVVAAAQHKPINFVGKTTLLELVALISRLDVLVTNDGGPLHVAVACGTKTVSLFGPVDEVVYGPYPPSEGHRVIKKDMACRPCYRNFRLGFCENQRACVESIDLDEVFEAVKKLLRKKG